MRVLQLIDSLHAGGAERVAVNFANLLAEHIDESFICSTREEGILKRSINKNVKYLFLNKKSTLDFAAIIKLKKYVKSNNIDIIHAHSSSFFLATLIKFISKDVKVVWHDHYGNSEFLMDRKSNVLKFCSKYFSYIFCVNKNLETWANQYLNTNQISYLPNFAIKNNLKPETKLSGVTGKKVICLANLRPQKDHVTLINSFSEVLKVYPEWSLHCVGKDFNDEYSDSLKKIIKSYNIVNNVYLYGSRPDISNILEQCEIGVLASKSEGLPIALLEYGQHELAVIATKVGECENVIETEENGILINPMNEKELTDGLLLLIQDENKRNKISYNFKRKVEAQYSANAIVLKLVSKYKLIK